MGQLAEVAALGAATMKRRRNISLLARMYTAIDIFSINLAKVLQVITNKHGASAKKNATF